MVQFQQSHQTVGNKLHIVLQCFQTLFGDTISYTFWCFGTQIVPKNPIVVWILE